MVLWGWRCDALKARAPVAKKGHSWGGSPVDDPRGEDWRERRYRSAPVTASPTRSSLRSAVAALLVGLFWGLEAPCCAAETSDLGMIVVRLTKQRFEETDNRQQSQYG